MRRAAHYHLYSANWQQYLHNFYMHERRFIETRCYTHALALVDKYPLCRHFLLIYSARCITVPHSRTHNNQIRKPWEQVSLSKHVARTHTHTPACVRLSERRDSGLVYIVFGSRKRAKGQPSCRPRRTNLDDFFNFKY